MITTNCPHLFKKAWSLKDHGKDFDVVFNKEHPLGFRWLHTRIGTNWRMMPIQAVIGIEALNLLDEWVKHRRMIANIYNENLKDISGVRITLPPKNIYHSYYKYYVFVVPSMLGGNWSRDKIMLEINKVGVPCFNTYGGEIYLEEAFNKSNLKPISRCSTAKLLGETCLQFLVHPTLEKTHIYDMTDKLSKVFSKIDHSDT